MIKKIIIAILILFILILSCSTIGRIPIPGAHVRLESLWVKNIVRRVIYRPVSYKTTEYPEILGAPYINEIQENDLFLLKNHISFPITTHNSHKRVPVGNIYFYYYSPFGFHIVISNLNDDIEKILLKECYLVKANNEKIDLFELPKENISQFFEWWSKNEDEALRSWDGSRIVGRGSGLLRYFDPIEIVMEKREDAYMDNIRFNFTNIPINYEDDIELIITFEFEIYTAEGIKTIRHQVEYTRLLEEYKYPRANNKVIREDEKDWNEITVKEWKKYL